MAKYRKKPAIIEAKQWTGKNFNELLLFSDDNIYLSHGTLFINTLEGRLRAEINDYLIKGVQGEVYFYKPDIFEATYERV